MLFERFNKWNTCLKKLQRNEITLQEFVNTNRNKTLYYSTPFLENGKGHFPNALQANGANIMLFPAFSKISDLKSHMEKVGCTEHIVIKGDLKALLDSLDSHPIIQTWGVVIDPHTSHSIELPPQMRVN